MRGDELDAERRMQEPLPLLHALDREHRKMPVRLEGRGLESLDRRLRRGQSRNGPEKRLLPAAHGRLQLPDKVRFGRGAPRVRKQLQKRGREPSMNLARERLEGRAAPRAQEIEPRARGGKEPQASPSRSSRRARPHPMRKPAIL